MTKLNAANVLRSTDGVTSPVALAVCDRGRVTVSLNMSAESIAMLDELAKAEGTSLDNIIAKAFILYKASADASRQGKAIGIAPTADVLETEFVGF